jgi:hypothetical protein
MARTASIRAHRRTADTSEEAVSKLHTIFENHLSKLPADEQARRWDALEEYVKKNAGDAGDAGAVRVARVGRRAKR